MGGDDGGTLGDHRCVAFDFPGQGASAPAKDGEYGFWDRAGAVASVVAARGLDRFVIVAHSGGCVVALDYAGACPEKVAGILMVDPPSDPRALPRDIRDGMVAAAKGPEGRQSLREYYTGLAGNDPETRERVLADATETIDAARVGVIEALAGWDPEPTLDAYRGPKRQLVSEASDGPAALYRLRPSIPHRVIPGTGHWIQLDAPEIVAEEIRTFVAGLKSIAWLKLRAVRKL